MARVESLRTENKFKKTEIGEIPVDWAMCRLGDHAYIKARIGWRGLSASEYTQAGPLLIAGNHIEGTKILWDRCDHLSQFRYDESPEIKLQNGDVIISKDGTIGRLGFIEYLPQEATIGGTMMLIRPDEKCFYPKYVYYYFQGEYFQNLIKEKVSGSSVPHIFQRDIVNLKIPLIPFSEQKKIAQILSTVDGAIEKSKEIIKKEKQLKKGLMQELLTRGIGHKRFKKTEIGGIPVEWSIAELGKVANITMGQSPSSKECYDYENGLPFFQGKAEFGAKYPKILKWCNSPKKTAEEGDTLISVRAPVGDINIAPTKCCIGRGLAAVRGTKADNAFIYFVMFSLQTALAKIGQGSTFEAINKNVLFKLKIPFPPSGEQEQISEILSLVDDKIEKEITNKERLERIKKGLMQVLLTGKVRIRT